MWADRVDHLKHLRREQPRDPYTWVQASELRPDDRFQFGGDWFRVITAAPVEPHVQAFAACGQYKTVVDYLAFEMVKVALPRPGTEPVV
jgi:hypothetical protein